MKRAQQHCYWAQHLLTGLKGLRGQVTVEETTFMVPVWAGQQHCLGQAPYSLHPLWIVPGAGLQNHASASPPAAQSL